MVNDDKLREIIAGCEGVTPGPWLVLRHGESDGEGQPWRHSWEVRQKDSAPTDKHHWPARIAESVAGVYPVSPSPDADHIARLDPATIKAMAEELLSLRAKLAPETDTDGIPFRP